MRISHRYKFVFISKPRCASTTVRNVLNPFSDIISGQEHPYHHHTTAARLKAHFEGMGWNWNDYFSFITIRNPWTMLVSLYHFGLPDRNGMYFWHRYADEVREKGYADKQCVKPENLIPFSDWLFEYDFSLYTLGHYTEDANGRFLVNSVLSYENINAELQDVSRKLGFEIGDLPRLCRTVPASDLSSYYGGAEQKQVEILFSKDLELGGYSIP